MTQNSASGQSPRGDKIDGTFYPLQTAEWEAAIRELTYAETKIYFWLKSQDPFGNRKLDLRVSAIADALFPSKKPGGNKGTVSKSLKALDSKGWIKLELIRVSVQIKTKKFPIQETRFPEINKEFPDGNESFAQETFVSPGKLSSAETQPESEFPNSLDSLDLLDPLLERGAKKKEKPTDQELKTNTKQLITDEPIKEPSKKPTSSSRSLAPAPAPFSSAYERWAASAHPALIYESDRTPWLLPPAGSTFTKFTPEFLDWGAREFMAKFEKADFYQAKADFRSHLVNSPEKIESKWEQYCSQTTHKAVVTAARIKEGISVPQEELVYLAENKAAVAPPEDVKIDGKILATATPEGADNVASYKLFSSDARSFWENVSKKVVKNLSSSTETEENELKTLNRWLHGETQMIRDKAIRDARRKGYEVLYDGGCAYQIVKVEG